MKTCQVMCATDWFSSSWVNLKCMKEFKLKPTRYKIAGNQYCRIRWVRDVKRKPFGIVNTETL